jgi:hypothetical protein
MAHFAQLDGNSIVLQVTVVSNADLIDQEGQEQEHLGVAVCETVVGPGPWVQTSYNGKFRKQFAGIGFTYDSDADVFIAPKPEGLDSWVLDANFDWVPPIPEPPEGGPYRWNEETTSWEQIVNEEPQIDQ